MMAPARKFSCLSIPSRLTLEQSNATGTSGSIEDWVVTLSLFGEGATTRLADAPRPSGFAVASNASETPAKAINRPTKTRRLKNADCEVDFFFMNDYEVELGCGTWLLAERQTRVNTFFYFSRFFYSYP